ARAPRSGSSCRSTGTDSTATEPPDRHVIRWLRSGNFQVGALECPHRARPALRRERESAPWPASTRPRGCAAAGPRSRGAAPPPIRLSRHITQVPAIPAFRTLSGSFQARSSLTEQGRQRSGTPGLTREAVRPGSGGSGRTDGDTGPGSLPAGPGAKGPARESGRVAFPVGHAAAPSPFSPGPPAPPDPSGPAGPAVVTEIAGRRFALASILRVEAR